MVIDLWEQLHTIFDSVDNRQPEIKVENITTTAAQAILAYLFSNTKEIQTALYPPRSRRQVMVCSQEEAIGKFTTGQLVGGFLVEPIILGFTMPVLGIFSNKPGHFAIDYEMGPQWTPVALIALFELFRMIRILEKDVVIRLSRQHFTQEWQLRFETTLRDYFHENPL